MPARRRSSYDDPFGGGYGADPSGGGWDTGGSSNSNSGWYDNPNDTYYDPGTFDPQGGWNAGDNTAEPGGYAGGEPGGYAGPNQGGSGGNQNGPMSSEGPQPYSGGYVNFAGFDASKFGKDSAPGSKYTKDAGVYSKAIGAGIDFGRGNLGKLIDFYRANGFPQAIAVGDDSIDPDGPGPQSPIDVIRSDGLKVYQNTTGNAQWEAKYGKQGVTPDGGGGDPGDPHNPHGGGGGGGYPPIPGGGAPATPGLDDLRKTIQDLYQSGGAFNQDIVNRRTEGAKENLTRQRKSQLSTDQASLAERGLLGSGAEVTGLARLNDTTDASYQNAVSDIYAQESQNADARMMQALELAGNMSEADAQHAIDQYRANTEAQSVANQYQLGLGNLDLGRDRLGLDRTLGFGNLALGNMNAINSYNLGMANYGLGRDRLMFDQQNSGMDRILEIIRQIMSGAQSVR